MVPMPAAVTGPGRTVSPRRRRIDTAPGVPVKMAPPFVADDVSARQLALEQRRSRCG